MKNFPRPRRRMKLLHEVSRADGGVERVYQRRWRGHQVTVIFTYVPSPDPWWDGDEPLPDHFECWDTDVKVKLREHEAKDSICNSWIDPDVEGRNGSDYLYQTACELLENALYDLAKQHVHGCSSPECIIQSVMEA